MMDESNSKKEEKRARGAAVIESRESGGAFV
jgi:hypothetical protein